MKKRKPKRGRPYTGGREPLRQFRMSDSEWREVTAAVTREKQTVSAFIRAAILAAARRKRD